MATNLTLFERCAYGEKFQWDLIANKMFHYIYSFHSLSSLHLLNVIKRANNISVLEVFNWSNKWNSWKKAILYYYMITHLNFKALITLIRNNSKWIRKCAWLRAKYFEPITNGPEINVYFRFKCIRVHQISPDSVLCYDSMLGGCTCEAAASDVTIESSVASCFERRKEVQAEETPYLVSDSFRFNILFL